MNYYRRFAKWGNVSILLAGILLLAGCDAIYDLLEDYPALGPSAILDAVYGDDTPGWVDPGDSIVDQLVAELEAVNDYPAGMNRIYVSPIESTTWGEGLSVSVPQGGSVIISNITADRSYDIRSEFDDGGAAQLFGVQLPEGRSAWTLDAGNVRGGSNAGGGSGDPGGGSGNPCADDSGPGSCVVAIKIDYGDSAEKGDVGPSKVLAYPY
jgi:hypothetical protein